MNQPLTQSLHSLYQVLSRGVERSRDGLYNHKFPMHVTTFFFFVVVDILCGFVFFNPRFIILRMISSIFRQNWVFLFPLLVPHTVRRLSNLVPEL